MFPATADSATSVGDMVLFTLLLYGALQMLVAALVIFMRRRVQPLLKLRLKQI
jgi:BASS family bile acid:Na+ symporter